VTKGIITPPPKWSAVRIGGPNSKGRDRHYVDGSALLRDQHPSLHARAKVANNMQDPRVRQDTKLALVACKGTICLENDSIRKYAEKEYKYGLLTPRRKNAATRAPAKKKPKKQSTQMKHAIAEAYDDDGASSASSASSTKASATQDRVVRNGKKRTAGKKRKAPTKPVGSVRKKGPCIDDSEEGTSAVDSPRAQPARKRGIRKRVLLAPAEHASASVAKYLTILSIAKMPRKDKIELLEVVLLTETDQALRGIMQDSLADDMDLQELTSILEEVECICSDEA
jgi:hypothetical protein